MKRSLAMAALAALLFSCSRRLEPLDGLIVIGDAHWDAGTVTANTSVEHTFTIKNVLQEPLAIEHIKQSCTCTDLSVTSMDVPPGGTSQITIVLTIEPKTFSKRATAYVQWTEHGEKKVIPLSVSAIASNRNRLAVDPPRLRLSPRTLVTSPELRVTYYFFEQPLDSVVVERSPEWCNSVVLEQKGSRHGELGDAIEQTFVVRLSVNDADQLPLPGEAERGGEIVLAGRGELVNDEQTLTVPILWFDDHDFEADPASVFLGSILPGTSDTTRSITLRRSGWSRAKIQSITCGHEAIDIPSWAQSTDGDASVEVVCDASALNGSRIISTTIVIALSGGDEGTMEVPVRGIVVR